MKILSRQGKDVDDSLMSQALCMSADAYASYDALDSDDGMNVVCALPSLTLKQFKRKMSSTTMVLATSGSKLVGMACVSKYKKGKLYLHTVYVKPACRNAGVGKSIVKRALKIAKKAKCSLMLDVNPLNEVAMSMYKSLGLRVCKKQTLKMESCYGT